MPQLLVRNVDAKVVRELKARAGRNGVSTEEEHRRILREALLKTPGEKLSFKEYLMQMPDLGGDELFERGPQANRSVDV
jgi:plasmid stability protein